MLYLVYFNTDVTALSRDLERILVKLFQTCPRTCSFASSFFNFRWNRKSKRCWSSYSRTGQLLKFSLTASSTWRCTKTPGKVLETRMCFYWENYFSTKLIFLKFKKKMIILGTQMEAKWSIQHLNDRQKEYWYPCLENRCWYCRSLTNRRFLKMWYILPFF